jgi:hypothetical protein
MSTTVLGAPLDFQFFSHKKCRQACPPGKLMCFSQGSIPESLVNKKIIIDKVIQHLLKVATPTEYKKYMVSTNV